MHEKVEEQRGIFGFIDGVLRSGDRGGGRRERFLFREPAAEMCKFDQPGKLFRRIGRKAVELMIREIKLNLECKTYRAVFLQSQVGASADCKRMQIRVRIPEKRLKGIFHGIAEVDRKFLGKIVQAEQKPRARRVVCGAGVEQTHFRGEFQIVQRGKRVVRIPFLQIVADVPFEPFDQRVGGPGDAGEKFFRAVRVLEGGVDGGGERDPRFLRAEEESQQKEKRRKFRQPSARVFRTPSAVSFPGRFS